VLCSLSLSFLQDMEIIVKVQRIEAFATTLRSSFLRRNSGYVRQSDGICHFIEIRHGVTLDRLSFNGIGRLPSIRAAMTPYEFLGTPVIYNVARSAKIVNYTSVRTRYNHGSI
jgi:hypothetical protein